MVTRIVNGKKTHRLLQHDGFAGEHMNYLSASGVVKLDPNSVDPDEDVDFNAPPSDSVAADGYYASAITALTNAIQVNTGLLGGYTTSLGNATTQLGTDQQTLKTANDQLTSDQTALTTAQTAHDAAYGWLTLSAENVGSCILNWKKPADRKRCDQMKTPSPYGGSWSVTKYNSNNVVNTQSSIINTLTNTTIPNDGTAITNANGLVATDKKAISNLQALINQITGFVTRAQNIRDAVVNARKQNQASAAFKKASVAQSYTPASNVISPAQNQQAQASIAAAQAAAQAAAAQVAGENPIIAAWNNLTLPVQLAIGAAVVITIILIIKSKE